MRDTDAEVFFADEWLRVVRKSVFALTSFAGHASPNLCRLRHAKPDRLAIGSILRSKLVFLVNVRSCDTRRNLGFDNCAAMHSAECVDIDNESNQVP